MHRVARLATEDRGQFFRLLPRLCIVMTCLALAGCNAEPNSRSGAEVTNTMPANSDSIPADNSVVKPSTRSPSVDVETRESKGRGTKVDGSAAAGNFVTALCRDVNGNIWVGTEDKGILRGTPDGHWTKFTTTDGLGDESCYALCCDQVGRIWAGHLNHGVAVFDGESWRNYDVIEGPLGERVFDIACCPSDGDVWMATSGGLARYSQQGDCWSYVTRAEGLPSDQLSAVAFAANGDLYLGTQCDGVVIARRDEEYANWHVMTGEFTDTKYRQPHGSGLPSPLINDIHVASVGTVYVATTLGLAKSKTKGKSWEYLRGRNYAEKVKGRFESPPKSWNALSGEKLSALLPEDYVTCLAEDDAGRLWIGSRQQGFSVIDTKSGVSFHGTKDTAGLKDSFVTVIQPDSTGRALVGTYGGGLVHLKDSIPMPIVKSTAVKPQPMSRPIAPHPAPAATPSVSDLQRQASILKSLKDPLPTASGSFLGDDWKTQGDWVGRIGRQYTILCAMVAPLNHAVVADFRYRVRGGVGPNGDELLRHWVHAIRSDDPRVLYNPVIGYRRQADWNDHADAYPMSHEGPDVWSSVEVPDGLHRISLYFFNKDGHDGLNRYRDYLIELKGNAPDPLRAERLPTLAKARVMQFWGGVYKQFIVTGPAKYSIKIGCNDSFNTIVQAVMVDQLAGPPDDPPDMPLPYLGNMRYDPPIEPILPMDADQLLLAATELKKSVDEHRGSIGGVNYHRYCRIQAYRAARSADAPPDLIANWNWDLRLWNDRDRRLFQEAMLEAWKKHLQLNPHLLEVHDPNRPRLP